MIYEPSLRNTETDRLRFGVSLNNASQKGTGHVLAVTSVFSPMIPCRVTDTVGLCKTKTETRTLVLHFIAGF